MAEPESNIVQNHHSNPEEDRKSCPENLGEGSSSSEKTKPSGSRSDVSRLAGQHLRDLDALHDAPTDIESDSPPDSVSALSEEEFQRTLQALRLLERLQQEESDPLSAEITSEFTGPESSHAVGAKQVSPCTPDRELTFGRFWLRREIGRGGFGLVYLAWDPTLDREVALKLPRPEMLMNRELCRRFALEGRAVAMLEHPNILPVLEAGEINGIPYLTSPFNVGPSLAEWLRSRADFTPPREAALLLAQLAEGVHHAHTRGIVHRDLKPGNILLTSRCEPATSGVPASTELEQFTPRVTDFGLAKNLQVEDHQTRTGVRMGTPRYSAPEQLEGAQKTVGPQTDVYALGVILYELLTLTPPYAEASGWQLQQHILQEDAPSPRSINPAIPADLEAICLKCLKKIPGDRYPSTEELARDLRRFLRGETVQARLPSPLERFQKWVHRNPLLASLYGTILFSFTALVLFGLWHLSSMHQINQQLKVNVDLAIEQAEVARLNSYAAQIRLAHGFLEAGQTGWMGDILKRLQPQENQAELREFSWHYLWNMARNDLHARGHELSVEDVAFASSSEFAVTVSSDRTIRVWDPFTGTTRRILTSFKNEPRSMTLFSGDQKVVAANRGEVIGVRRGGPGEVRIWEITGKQLHVLHDTVEIASRVAVSPDGQTIAYGRMNSDMQGAVCLWKPESNKRTYLLPGTAVASALAFAPDGSLAIAGHDDPTKPGKITLFHPDLVQIRTEWPAHESWIRCLAFSPDGRELLSGGHDGLAQIWEIPTGKPLATIEQGKLDIHHVEYSGDGKRLAYLVEVEPRITQLHLVDKITRQSVCNPYRVEKAQYCFALNLDASLVVTGGIDHLVRFWQPRPLSREVDLAAHELETWGVGFTPDGRSLLTSSDDHLFKVWDLPSLKLRWTFTSHDALVACLAVTPNGRLAATGSFDNTVRLWDLQQGKEIAVLRSHSNHVRTVAFSPSGELLASSGRDETICLWDVRTHQLIRTLQEQKSNVRQVNFSPDGKYFASACYDRTIRVWETSNWTMAHEWKDSNELFTVHFSPDSKLLATCGGGRTPTFWDLNTGQSRTVLGGHEDRVLTIAFSPDGQTLASGGLDRTVRLWHVPTGLELICFRNLPHQVNSLTFSPDGRTLAAALHDGKVRLWGNSAWQSQGMMPR